MPAPDAIFIDTGIFDRECYDFTSSRIQALLTALASEPKTLLLPQPTKQEIIKHINERCRQAIVPLMKARETHPLLRGKLGIPQTRPERDQMIAQLREATMAKLAEFQSHFTLRELDYSGINLAEIMTWYEQVKPPFGTGEKQKEFPDAFAVATLRAYAIQSGKPVAVVSTDGDFKKFCETEPLLSYYSSLDALTVDVVADANEAAKIAKAESFALASIPAIKDLISSAFPDRGFWHQDAPGDEDENIDNIVVEECTIEPDDIQITGITAYGLTVSFHAEVTFTADVEYADPDSWVNMGDGDIRYMHRCAGNVTDTTTIHGTVTLETDDQWEEVQEITNLTIKENYVTIRESAPQVDDHDYDDDLS